MWRFDVLLLAGLTCLVLGCDKTAGPGEKPATDVPGPQSTTFVEKGAKESDETDNQGADEWYRLYRERMKNPVKLGKIPQIVPQEVPVVDAKQSQKIKTLIGELARIERPDYGFSSTMSGRAFRPVDGQHDSGAFLITNHDLRSPAALKQLVSLGPDALPFLLESLDDQTPTKFRLKHESMIGAMWFDQEMGGNPLNPLEAEILEIGKNHKGKVNRQESHVREHIVKVGDICFVAIGQIVGRSYQTVRYQPTACIVINSPTHDQELASKVRKIWGSKVPWQLLFESLLRDYSSIGIYHEGDSLDVWDIGSELQCNAALRLLYYYPAETGSLIAERLRGFDVQNTREGKGDRFIEREVQNGARTNDFIHAVSWSQVPVVREVLTELFLKTTDDEILLAALPGVDDPKREIIPRRLQPLMEKMPSEEGPIYGSGWKLLFAWAKASPESAKKAMQEYIENGVVQRLQTACAVLRDTSPDWKVQFLRPFLDDRRDLKSWTSSETRNVGGQEIKIRLCDMAAHVLAEQDKTLIFKLEGPVEQVDLQIAAIRKELDKRSK